MAIFVINKRSCVIFSLSGIYPYNIIVISTLGNDNVHPFVCDYIHLMIL
ncbi:hypothetical protein FIM1_2441 [Kluyveromyces marxianus]|uniref:Uncharacterized protein n=1 Tax=Kluyveromyces marxianus TaxID=4911 RepID=A0ABX6EVJ5_KLUMA|nr:hypothetical protein FIM1_2441 [Kluyveromyces marxianus]